MKCTVFFFLTFMSYQGFAIEYTIDWHYHSKFITDATSYHIKVKVNKDRNSQTITFHLSDDFPYSMIMTGVADTEQDECVRSNLGRTQIIYPTVPDPMGVTAYQNGSTTLQTVNLLMYMAQALNGHSGQIPQGALVNFPYLPPAMFPGSAQALASPPEVFMEMVFTDMVHLTVNQGEGQNQYHLYLQYQDGNYLLIVSHQHIDPSQALIIFSLHQSVTESGQGSVPQASYVQAGISETSFQYASIPEDVFLGLTGVVYAPSAPDSESGSVSTTASLPAIGPNLSELFSGHTAQPPAAALAVITALIKTAVSCLSCAPCYKK